MGDHPQREVQRPLAVTSPLMHGPDVAELQDSINKILSTLKLSGHLIEDGEFGEHTKRLANKVAYALGIHPQGEGAAGPTFTQEEQKLIRDPGSRSKEQKERSEKRVAELHAREQANRKGVAAAVKYAHDKIGTTEHPLGSNRGPDVDAWIRYSGLNPVVPPPGVFWCGCFAGYCVVHEGEAKVAAGNLINHQVIVNLAHAGGFGLTPVSFSDAQPGDIVSYTFQHIGLIVGPSISGRLHTIEGNTSEFGHVSNGGGVYEHTDRTAGVVLGISRPDYS